MKSLKCLLEDALSDQQNNTVELPKLNIVISALEKEKKLTFAPLDPAKPAPKSRTFINDLKAKFKISMVQQQGVNTFVVTLDPREDFAIVLDYLQEASEQA